jgi:hypothetical protein
MNIPDRVKSMIGMKACEHPRNQWGRTEEKGLVCLYCQAELPEPTTIFRSYIRLNKHLRLRVGTPTTRNGKLLDNHSSFLLGMRYVIVSDPHLVKRVWLTFDAKKDRDKFAREVNLKMRLASDDELYNEVINQALDLIRIENPGVVEQVAQDGDNE